MSDTDQVYAEALRRIEAWRAGQELNLAIEHLAAIPPEIARLTALERLTFWNVGLDGRLPLSDLSPLAGLSALQSLGCSRTQVSDLSPLAGLSALQHLSISRCTIGTAPAALWHLPGLNTVYAWKATLPGIPAEVLPPDILDNCLPAIRAHLSDVGAGAAVSHDGKLLVLGNGRIGKTQLCRRLRGEGYDDTVDSTHGITVTSAAVAQQPQARWAVWDFGGQDIYHGTHALFLKTRSVFVVCWTQAMEEQREHDHGGMTFRKYPLAYWLDYVRQFAGADAAVLVVQTQCDTRHDGRAELPPEVKQRLNAFAHHEVLQFSAFTDRGLDDLQDALVDAYRALDQPELASSWVQVKRRLIDWRDADAARTPGERQHQTVSLTAFEALCREVGNVSNPRVLLEYLHRTGTVFWQDGLFENALVLDQEWALSAIYAVFHRGKVYRLLERLDGRFTRTLLGELLWDEAGYSPAEQDLFIGMMRSCGICFRYREQEEDKRGHDGNTEYIAPDLLPEASPNLETKGLWQPDTPGSAGQWHYDLLPPSLIRSMIAEIGGLAGYVATYWRDGVAFFDATTRARAVIAQTMDGEAGWSGTLSIRTQSSDHAALLARILTILQKHEHRLGLTVERPEQQAGPTARDKAAASPQPEPPPDTEDGEAAAVPLLRPSAKPFAKPGQNWFVSYAWADDTSETGRHREDVVNELCSRAEAAGFIIHRDKQAMSRGDSILKFMTNMSKADRIFIVLSEKYLHSPYCMTELLEIWRHSRQEEDDFLLRIRVLVLPDAKIWEIEDRLDCADHWERRYEGLRTRTDKMGPGSCAAFQRMKGFAHQVDTILEILADRLQATTIEQLAEDGLQP